MAAARSLYHVIKAPQSFGWRPNDTLLQGKAATGAQTQQDRQSVYLIRLRSTARLLIIASIEKKPVTVARSKFVISF